MRPLPICALVPEANDSEAWLSVLKCRAMPGAALSFNGATTNARLGSIELPGRTDQPDSAMAAIHSIGGTIARESARFAKKSRVRAEVKKFLCWGAGDQIAGWVPEIAATARTPSCRYTCATRESSDKRRAER
jgi:hypothetical protein